MLSLHSEATVASVFAPRTTIDADGTVEGYASLFGEIDPARDMVMRGAFADTLASRGIRRIPMLFQHDPSEPVGIWLELREDFHGLFARGRLIPEVAREMSPREFEATMVDLRLKGERFYDALTHPGQGRDSRRVMGERDVERR